VSVDPVWDSQWGPRRAPRARRFRSLVKKTLASLMAVGRSPRNPSRGVAILAYHGTGAERGRPWWIDFRGQMALIEDLGYRVVSLAEAVELTRDATPPAAPTLAITFDDGFANNLDVAYPELARRGWTATVFVATSYVDRRPYLTAKELPRVVELGLEVGNHTHGHPDVRGLEPAKIVEEISECSRRLEDLIGSRPRHFCYPNGRYGPTARNAVAGTEMEGACTGRVGFNPPGADPFLLRRLTLERGDGPRQLRARLAGGYDFQDLSQRYMDRD
jgi:peptidoglycan/xylan/chitin deacetylase (PgdA/CDA1 family)